MYNIFIFPISLIKYYNISAMQRRIVQCIGGDVVVSPSLCNAQERPPHRQECYNDKCKGVWRTDHWSEVCVDSSVLKC